MDPQQPPPKSVAHESNRPSVRVVIWVVLIVLALIFIAQNSGEAAVDVLFWDFTAPGWFWLLALFLGGVVVGSIAPWFRRKKKKRSRHRPERRPATIGSTGVAFHRRPGRTVTMDLNELISQLPVDQLAEQLGVTPEEAKKLSKESVGALVAGMQANAKDPGGAQSLTEALGQHSGDALGGLTDLSAVDTDDGDKIVNHVFGDQREAVVNKLGETEGGGGAGGMFAKLLPMLAPVVLGYLAKSMAGKSGAPASGETADAGGGGLGDMLGGLLGGGEGAEGGGGLSDMLGGLLGGGGDSGEGDEGGGSSITDMLGGLLGGGRTG